MAHECVSPFSSTRICSEAMPRVRASAAILMPAGPAPTIIISYIRFVSFLQQQRKQTQTRFLKISELSFKKRADLRSEPIWSRKSTLKHRRSQSGLYPDDTVQPIGPSSRRPYLLKSLAYRP